MRSQLYLWEPLRQRYIDDLTLIKTMFIERIQPIFANAEKESEEYQNELWESIINRPCTEDNYVDPGDYVGFVQEKAVERYEMLSLMRYRNIGMWIACLCQVWEQQLYSFIIHEAQQEGIKYDSSDIKRGFAFSKEVFEWHQQPFEQMATWAKIKELRLLVNVIKHAEGDSEQKLRTLRPDYFTEEVCGTQYDLMVLYHTTLLEPTLMIKEQDFTDYYDALVKFWTDLPERMYTADEL